VEDQEPAASYPQVVKSFDLVLVRGHHQNWVVHDPNQGEEGRYPCRNCDQMRVREMACGWMGMVVARHFVIGVSAEILNFPLRATTVMCCRPVVRAHQRPGHQDVKLVYVWCVPFCYESTGDNEGKEEWAEESPVYECDHCENVDFLVAYWGGGIKHEREEVDL
jgi:hypothetical protein